MGLDITCYEKIEPFEGDVTVEQSEDGSLIHWYTLKGYEDRLDGIKAEYVEPSCDVFGFRAGSYGGYNSFRRTLAQVINGKEPEFYWGNDSDDPFNELINFADNEGCIGPKTCAKLAKDFEDYTEKFESSDEVDVWDIQSYRNWRKGFHLAAGNGCVEFH